MPRKQSGPPLAHSALEQELMKLHREAVAAQQTATWIQYHLLPTTTIIPENDNLAMGRVLDEYATASRRVAGQTLEWLQAIRYPKKPE